MKMINKTFPARNSVCSGLNNNPKAVKRSYEIHTGDDLWIKLFSYSIWVLVLYYFCVWDN